MYDQMGFKIHSKNQLKSTQIKTNVGFRGNRMQLSGRKFELKTVALHANK